LADFKVKILLQQQAVNDLNNQLKAIEKQLKPLVMKLDSGDSTAKEQKKIESLLSVYNKIQKQIDQNFVTQMNTEKTIADFKEKQAQKELKAIQDQANQDQANHQKRLQMLQKEKEAQQQARATQVAQYTPIGGDQNLNLASMDRYNKYIEQQNSALKAGRISEEEYIQSTQRIIDQTKKWELADDNLRSKILSNRNSINKANKPSTPTPQIIDTNKAQNDLIKLEQTMSKIMGSASWRSSTKQQQQSFDEWGQSIQKTKLNLDNMSHTDFNNFVRNMRTNLSGVNGEVQNVDRNSLHLGL